MIEPGQTRTDLESLGFIFKMSFYKNDIIGFEKNGVMYKERFLSSRVFRRNTIAIKPINCEKYKDSKDGRKEVSLGKTKKIVKYRMDILGNQYICENEKFSRYC